jgi:membrane fusion protein (multidrug efflux system)
MRIQRHYYLAAALALAGCNKSESSERPQTSSAPPPPITVETAPVEIRKMPRFLTLTGSIIADRQSEVAANVSGRITSAPVERGQAVRRGQVLAVVDSRAAGLSASAAFAQSKVAETQEKQAHADCERADLLMQKGAISKSEFDRMKSQCSAQVFSAKAAVASADLARKQLGDTIVRAPFDGIIGERYVNVGEYLQPQTKVASVVRVNPVRVQISVPESATPLIKQKQKLAVKVAAFGDREFPATIEYVAPALRAQTRDLIIEAVAQNEDGALRPGMFSTVSILVGEEDQPTVPEMAITQEGTTRRLFLVRGGQAWEMVVRTGTKKEGRIATLEPLAAGERVVIKAPPGLHDGVAVR